MTFSKNLPAFSLAFGPMSSEIIEAVFAYSQSHHFPLLLIASKNQIDHSGGYVNNWTTKEFMLFIEKMRKKNPGANVKICRDHCGPGFNGKYNILDVYKTIKEDIDCGFDLIHIDYSHFKGTREEKLEAAKRAIIYALRLKPSILIEIGTDENTGDVPKLKDLEEEILFFKDFCNPEFYVVQTGSLIKEINQVGQFNTPSVKEASKILKKYNLKLKEHNADYLSGGEIKLRRGLVDGLNIAPQLGVVQTQTVLARCLIHKIPTQTFLEEVYRGGNWKKWMYKSDPSNTLLCSIIAGHYHFTSAPYLLLIQELSKYEDIRKIIITEISKTIAHYVQNTKN